MSPILAGSAARDPRLVASDRVDCQHEQCNRGATGWPALLGRVMGRVHCGHGSAVDPRWAPDPLTAPYPCRYAPPTCLAAADAPPDAPRRRPAPPPTRRPSLTGALWAHHHVGTDRRPRSAPATAQAGRAGRASRVRCGPTTTLAPTDGPIGACDGTDRGSHQWWPVATWVLAHAGPTNGLQHRRSHRQRRGRRCQRGPAPSEHRRTTRCQCVVTRRPGHRCPRGP